MAGYSCYKYSSVICVFNEQVYTLKSWVEGLSDEAFYPRESPKKIRLKSVNPTFVTEQKKVSIHQVFQNHKKHDGK